MAKVTSKLQVTVPKAIADRFGIRPGDDITFHIEGNAIRVVRAHERPPLTVAERLAVFDEATKRQEARNKLRRRKPGTKPPANRGWTREELYTRGGTR